ncbi:hypothetical protein TRFO_02588 [Tritrichomonas foetus]|uniref:Uncharacterized protein n=1 Tax=Tritrichomonas foetus TaxID=1144522 RepID=A0A1J4L6G0_9EUKA|nr:hypothetical protein TRFO_02588 [Tritrichomonas foetus]|eukprot:OHT17534.1 hypothetical protein TRFO_02588 [Tritrichomonas foetus]
MFQSNISKFHSFDAKSRIEVKKEHTFFVYLELSLSYEYHELCFSLQKYLHSLPLYLALMTFLITLKAINMRKKKKIT